VFKKSDHERVNIKMNKVSCGKLPAFSFTWLGIKPSKMGGPAERKEEGGGKTREPLHKHWGGGTVCQQNRVEASTPKTEKRNGRAKTNKPGRQEITRQAKK